MNTLSLLEFEILDATADDWEDLERIYKSVAYEVVEIAGTEPPFMRPYLQARPKTNRLHEVADAVHDLVRRGMLEGILEDGGGPLVQTSDASFVWRAWFRMTSAGREAWLANEAYAEVAQSGSNHGPLARTPRSAARHSRRARAATASHGAQRGDLSGVAREKRRRQSSLL